MWVMWSDVFPSAAAFSGRGFYHHLAAAMTNFQLRPAYVQYEVRFLRIASDRMSEGQNLYLSLRNYLQSYSIVKI